jgi:NTE family protein
LAAVWSIFENKLETLANSSPIIDKSSYLSAFVYMKYDSFNDKISPKKDGIFLGICSLTFFRQTIQMNFNRSILQKEILALLQRYLKERRLKQNRSWFCFR